MAGEKVTTVSYITHHLQNAQIGNGFMTVNIDTVSISAILGLMIIFFAFYVRTQLNPAVPTKLQNFVEILFEFIQGNVKESCSAGMNFVAPIALTAFVWIWLMNFMDLIPVDLLPYLAQIISGDHDIKLKVVPTTDINTTLGMSATVFMLVIFTHIKNKGLIGFFKMFMFHPFGKYLIPVNVIMTLVEEVAKPLSLALRLFGNMFAGELVFLLIALIGGALAYGTGAILWGPIQVILDLVWLLFHVFVITLQAFIFMVLTVVYIGLAQDDGEH